MKKIKIPKPNMKYIIVKKSKIHNNGVFAKKDIKKGTKVIEYVGEIVTSEVGNKRAEQQYKLSKRNRENGAVYVFELNNKYDIDGCFKYNTARFINHSCEPNCKYKQEKLRIWIVAIRNIKKGEEISYDYGYDLEDYKNHRCKCGKKTCIGYIIGKKYKKEFEKLRKKK
jgi:uncharacterized protein